MIAQNGGKTKARRRRYHPRSYENAEERGEKRWTLRAPYSLTNSMRRPRASKMAGHLCTEKASHLATENRDRSAKAQPMRACKLAADHRQAESAAPDPIPPCLIHPKKSGCGHLAADFRLRTSGCGLWLRTSGVRRRGKTNEEREKIRDASLAAFERCPQRGFFQRQWESFGDERDNHASGGPDRTRRPR